mgnify:CR=1 FL=1
MDEQSLALAFGSSLTEEVSSIAGEYVELGLDALVEDGLFKDIPIVSTAVAVYRIGKSIREKHHIAKLISFLNEINKGIADEEKRQNYREKFTSNEKFRNQELEYILILIDRYISFDKPQMLAKLYLAYLDGRIKWDEFTQYAEVIDRLLPGDIYPGSDGLKYARNKSDSQQRLAALGLMRGTIPSPSVDNGVLSFSSAALNYELTQFGRTLLNILNPQSLNKWLY